MTVKNMLLVKYTSVTDETSLAELLFFRGNLSMELGEPSIFIISGSFKKIYSFKSNKLIIEWEYKHMNLTVGTNYILSFWVIAYTRDTRYYSFIYQYAIGTGVHVTDVIPPQEHRRLSDTKLSQQSSTSLLNRDVPHLNDDSSVSYISTLHKYIYRT